MPEKLLHVLFVCVENSCRSQMAEGFARALASDRVVAHSAGSRPSGQVNPRAMRFMAERGIDLSHHASTGLDDIPQGVVWDWVVTMGCGDACPCAGTPAARPDLQIPRTWRTAARGVRDRISSGRDFGAGGERS
jgi:protein-tyrosine-phosphatase